MEVSEQTLVQLVNGQATTAQAVRDLKETIDKAIPVLVAEDKKNAKDIAIVRNRVYYFGGAGTVLGYFLSGWAKKFLNLGG